MSVRLFHKDARLVLVVARREGERESEHRWIGLHLSPHAWASVFQTAWTMLDLHDESPLPAGESSGNSCHSPHRGVDLRWTPSRCWTRIDLRLTKGSLRKRQLIAAALLKAARYQLL